MHARQVFRISTKFLVQMLLGWKDINREYEDKCNHRLGREDTLNFGHVEFNIYHGYLTRHG